MKKKQKTEVAMQIEFICPKCNTHLAWALPSAEISCPKCGKWVTKKNSKRESELYLPLNDDQLSLFK